MAAKKGMYQGELPAAAAELANIIQSGRADLAACTELVGRWSEVVLPTGLSVAEVLRIEVSELLDASELRGQEPYRGRLLAARWLLNLGDYAASDARQDMGRMGVVPGLTDRNVGDKGVRAQIAFVCLRWEPYWRAEAQPGARIPPGARTAFNPNGSQPSPRTRDVAAELARAIEERRALLDDPVFLAARQLRWRELLLPVAAAQQPEVREERAARGFRRLAAVWNEPSRHYPRHLTPVVLAEQLTLSTLREDRINDGQQGLYSNERTYSGRPFLEVLADERRLVVLGNPGGGKSTALVAAVVDRIERNVPAIVVRLSSVAQSSPKRRPWTLERVVEYLVKVAASDTVAPGVSGKALTQALLTADGALIALDGLDEVQAEHDDHVRAVVRALAEFPGTVVLSSRWTGYMAPPGLWEERSVDNLGDGSAASFFESWFGGENPSGLERARAALDKRVSMRSDLTEIPVLLGIVAVVAGEREVPATEPLLYEQYVSMFLEGYWRPHSARVELTERLRRLEAARELAWAMATGMTGQVAGREWSDVVTPYALHRYDPELLPALESVRVTGLLAPQGKSTTELLQEHRWIHRTVHEHLVGAYFAPRFDAAAEHFGLPPEMLMAAPQWQQPLRHLIGLLDEADQEAFLWGMEALVDAGDPGGPISFLVKELAVVFPHGAGIRQKLARKRAAERNTYGVWFLDIDCYKELLTDVLRKGAESELNAAPSFFDMDAANLDEAYARELVECQRAALRTEVGWIARSSGWLSRFAPDEALRFLIENKIAENYYLPHREWAKAPSPGAVEAAINEIATWAPGERLSHLEFLATIGVDLAPHVSPAGPLDGFEVLIAVTLRDAFPEDNAARANQWPAGVAEAVFSGQYGAWRAFGTVLEEREHLPDGIRLGAAARLALDAFALKKRTAIPAETVDPVAAKELIAAITPDRILDDVVASQMVAAAGELLGAADRVPIEWCFQAHWALGKCYFPPRDDPRYTAFRYTYTYEAISEAIVKVLLTRGRDLVREILRTDPNAWAASTYKYADFEIVKALHEADLLSVDDLVELIVWAGRDDVQMLHYLRLGDHAPKVAQLVWEAEPRAFLANSHQWGLQLAEAGVLWEWRDRLIESAAGWASLLDQWKAAA